MSRRIAIIGSGAAGLSAAWHLHDSCHVTLFEREAKFGGHAWTFVVPDGPDAGLPLDVAFMVMNKHNYPRMCSLLSQIGEVELGPSEMSFSYCCRASGEEYAINHDYRRSTGSRETNNSPLKAALSPLLVSLLGEVIRFCRTAEKDLASIDLDECTLNEYLAKRSVSESLKKKYILPMGAALWSAPPGQILDFPAKSYLRFLDNHGLLSAGESLNWNHIRGGSRKYVDAIIAALGKDSCRLADPVTHIIRHDSGVTVKTASHKTDQFDAVIIATHADHALSMLSNPTQEEQRLLSAIRYQRNKAILHWDESVMPRDQSAWASWNYERESLDDPNAVCVNYHLNRLQDHRHSARQYFLTLNRRAPIDEDKILMQTDFEHPIFDIPAMRAQQALSHRGLVDRVCFAGSYLGYGFHEDAIASGVAAANVVKGA